MSSNCSIEPNTTITGGGEGEQKDQIAAAVTTKTEHFGAPASSLHEPHFQEVNEKKSKPSVPSKKGPKRRQAQPKAEGSTGSNSTDKKEAEDAWNWLLKVEENYQETIANATQEFESRIYADNSGPESDEDDEKNYKYYYLSPSPEEPTRTTTSSSEPWFAAGYTDYRDSYASSESEAEDEPTYDADSEAEEETTARPVVVCGTCHRQGCECTNSILAGLASASLSETGEDDESAEK